jgi:hypothetical protein
VAAVLAAAVLGRVAFSAVSATPLGSVLPLTRPSAARAVEWDVVANGFDTACAPDKSQMATLWDDSPYFFIGIYIGGVNESCDSSDLTKNWQTDVTQIDGAGDGWDLEPFWVGDQSACIDQSGKFEYIPSSSTTAAYNDGVGAAKNAAAAAENLGLGAGVIYFDLEAFNYTNSTCLSDAEHFIDGWDYQMSVNTPFFGGLYGSSEGSDLGAFNGIEYPPYAIAPADTDGDTNVYDTPGISSSDWVNRRIKQYLEFSSETFGNVTIAPGDKDCADGPLNGGSDWDVAC